MQVCTYYDEAGDKHLALVTRNNPRPIPDPNDPTKTLDDKNPPATVAFLNEDGITDGNGTAIVTRAGVLHASEVNQPDNSEDPRVPYWEGVDLPGFPESVTRVSETNAHPVETPGGVPLTPVTNSEVPGPRDTGVVPAEPSNVPPTALPDVSPENAPVTAAEVQRMIAEAVSLAVAGVTDRLTADEARAQVAAQMAPPEAVPPSSTVPPPPDANADAEAAAAAQNAAERQAASNAGTDVSPNSPSDAVVSGGSVEGEGTV